MWPRSPGWQESLDQTLAELPLAAAHRAQALAAILEAIAQGATWHGVGVFRRDGNIRVSGPR